MFPVKRQAKLDPILHSLRQLPGIRWVTQEDFDSSGINLSVSLMGTTEVGFQQPLNVTKRRIKSVLRKAGVSFADFDMPRRKYHYSPAAPGIPREVVPAGYDTTIISLAIDV